ncbi:MAG: hypothetical protein RBR98_01905 [Candidatus Moranbacteria bacterium]|jgi:hypothetical protein|nr:hypothetical protein [Candidatus Moranbacteria bacterium]
MEKYLTIPISVVITLASFMFISIIVDYTSNEIIDGKKGLKRLFLIYCFTSFIRCIAIIQFNYSFNLLWVILITLSIDYVSYSQLFLFDIIGILIKAIKNRISLFKIKVYLKKIDKNEKQREKNENKIHSILMRIRDRNSYLDNYDPLEDTYMNIIESSIFDNIANYFKFILQFTIRVIPITLPIAVLVMLYFDSNDFQLSYSQFALKYIDYIGFIIIGLAIIWGVITKFIINALTIFLRVFKLNYLYYDSKIKNSISFMVGTIAILLFISHESIITSDVQLLKQYENIITMVTTIVSIVFVPILLEYLFNRQARSIVNKKN